MVAFALCSETSLGIFHIFSSWGWMQVLTFFTCLAVSTGVIFCQNCKLYWFISSMSFVIHLRFISCSYWSFSAGWICWAGESHVHFHLLCPLSYWQFSWRFLWCSKFRSSGCRLGRQVFHASKIMAAIPYTRCALSVQWDFAIFLCIVCIGMSWSLCISNHVILWHLGTSWVVTDVAVLTCKAEDLN